MPFLRLGLALIATVYLARGVVGVPVVLMMDDAYSMELRARMPFMIVTSAICVYLGLCYAFGVYIDCHRSWLERSVASDSAMVA